MRTPRGIVPLMVVALIVSVSACALDTPGIPAPTAFSVSGRVTYAGPVAGVSVKIMDGIHVGQTRPIDASGLYSFTDLAPSVFTLQAAAPGFIPENKAVNLTTANQFVNFNISDH